MMTKVVDVSEAEVTRLTDAQIVLEEHMARPSGQVNWADLVERIRVGDATGMEQLYRIFSRGVRFYFYRQLGSQDVEDKVHDVLLIVVQAIRNGSLREPERLMGYVRTIVRYQVAGHIHHTVQTRKQQIDLDTHGMVADSRQDPERAALLQQRAEIMMRALQSISERDRDILTRFYLLEQPQGQICKEMNLTDTQFRLIKSRAKAKFGVLGRREIAKTTITFSRKQVRSSDGFRSETPVPRRIKA